MNLKSFKKNLKILEAITQNSNLLSLLKEGTKTLLTVLPTNHSTTKPEGGLQSDGVHCLYIKTHNFPAANINTEFRNNVRQLKEYLEWLKADVNEYNKNLKSLISTTIQQRKQKAQRDKDDAESLGFPVK